MVFSLWVVNSDDSNAFGTRRSSHRVEIDVHVADDEVVLEITADDSEARSVIAAIAGPAPA